MSTNRRDFIKNTALMGSAVAIGSALSPFKTSAEPAIEKEYGELTKHTLPPLDYAYDALEPYIDARTLEIHHDKHHAGYVNGLNTAEEELAKARNYLDLPMVDYWTKKSAFHGAGHFLHSLYWKSMTPHSTGNPDGILLEAINRDFGTQYKFRDQFSKIAKTVQGSGWAVLAVRPADKRLLIFQVENHEKLVPLNIFPLLVLDVWEHAYYLKYQNKRGDYISNWWNVVNWEGAGKLLAMHK